MSLEKVKFFGASDRKGKKIDNEIASAFPSWYFTRDIEELEKSIAENKRELDRDIIAGMAKLDLRNKVEAQQERLALIKRGIVRLSDKEKDEAAELYETMSKEITDSMFTRTEMMKGTADAHEEARRMKQGIIKVPPKFKKVAENMGCRIDDKGRISRDDASRMFKMTGKLLGENTNTERLRRDHKHGRFQYDVPIEEMTR